MKTNQNWFIYKLTNQINGKPYIGQTINIKQRLIRYEKLNCRAQRKLYNALKKYGYCNFKFEILKEVHCQIDADLSEIHYIEEFDSIKNGYNIKEGGSHGLHSEETKIRMSVARTGKTSGENNPMYGLQHTPESKLKMSLAKKDKPISEFNWKLRYGVKRHLSETHKQNISKGLVGFKLSTEAKQKISKALKGRVFSEEHKRKISEAKQRKKLNQIIQ